MGVESRYTTVRGGGRALARLGPVVQFGVMACGVAWFLQQSQGLLSDAQFTWAERRILAGIAVSTAVGFGFAGWVLGKLIGVAAELLDVLADGAEASWRTVDLLETHVIPSLGRIAANREAGEAPSRGPADSSAVPSSSGRRVSAVDELKAELERAKADGAVERAFDARDALTEHLRGESLHSLDAGLATWVSKLVERRVRGDEVDWEVAAWASRAVDSLGDVPETRPLRAALPTLRRKAGLCESCGRAVAGGQVRCGKCRSVEEQGRATSPAPDRTIAKERP